MPAPMTPRARRTATAAFVGCILAAVAVVAMPASKVEDPLVFALSVLSPEGRVLASPVVVGAPGQKVEVRLMCEKDPRVERMSLVLDPLESSPDGSMDYKYELSVAGRVEKVRGTVRLLPGDEKSIAVRPAHGFGDPRGVQLALFAAPLKHPGVEQYLKDRREKRARPHI